MKILMYTRNNPPCQFCTLAKTMLKYYQLPYKNIVIGEDITREEFMNMITESGDFITHVPAIYIDDEYIGGYRELEQLIWKTQPRKDYANNNE